MSGTNAVPISCLNSEKICATMDCEYVQVSRQSLETEHRQLLSRLHEVRRLLGYPPLLTGKERRRQPQR